MALRRSHDTDIQQVVSRAVSQYQTQLNAAQTCTWEHQVAIQQLQEQFRTLKLSLASWADLPSVGQSQGNVDLWEEVFNILPGMVNINHGATLYQSPDQPFSFQKQVQFGDRPDWPDLRSDTDQGKWVLPPTTIHNMPHSSTPYHSGVPHANLLN